MSLGNEGADKLCAENNSSGINIYGTRKCSLHDFVLDALLLNEACL